MPKSDDDFCFGPHSLGAIEKIIELLEKKGISYEVEQNQSVLDEQLDKRNRAPFLGTITMARGSEPLCYWYVFIPQTEASKLDEECKHLGLYYYEEDESLE